MAQTKGSKTEPECQLSLADQILWDELQHWWYAIAQITKEESPLLYEMSAAAREWARNNGCPHAP